MMQTKYDVGQEVLVKGRVDHIRIDKSGETRYYVPVRDGDNVYTHILYENDLWGGVQEQKEKVDHPDHYNQLGKKECIEQMYDDYGDAITGIFCYTNAYKYLYRAGCKDGESKEEDMAKAKWYIDYADKHCCLLAGTKRIVEYVKEELKKYE